MNLNIVETQAVVSGNLINMKLEYVAFLKLVKVLLYMGNIDTGVKWNAVGEIRSGLNQNTGHFKCSDT